MVTPAMSSGRPMRLRGAAAAICSPNALRVAAIIFDSNGPGAMALTVMVGANCLARCRVRWCTAALDAEYEYVSSAGTRRPSMEPTLMTLLGSSAEPAASSSGRKNLVVWKTPCTLRLSTRSHEAVSCSSSGAPQVAPALLTSTSTRGCAAATAVANVRAPSSFERSATMPEHVPKAESSATAPSTASALREATTTVAPAATKPPAIIRPIPRVPPVTTMVFPSTENSSAGGVVRVHGLRRYPTPGYRSGGVGRVPANGSDPVRLALTDEQEELRLTLRSYFADLVQETASNGGRPDYVATIRRMGADGWLGIGWPVEYGGHARGPVDQMIFVEESHWAGVPLPLLTLNSVGPAIMQLGTDEQKQRILPGILRGEVHFSIGYTEPTAGTDLAALRTRAVRDGDEYVINGEKLYTSAIQYADYVWLATRTDPDAPKHKGLSVFIVPTDTPGFSWTPLPTVAGEFTSSTYYEDVRVPAANLVGGENQGWTLMTNQLNHERVAICPVSGILRSIEEVRAWAQEECLADGRRAIDQEWVRVHLARLWARAEYLKLLNWNVAWAADKGLRPADASATKVYGSEFALEAYRLLLEIVGQCGYLPEGSPGAVLRGRLEQQSRSQTIFTFGGGTNEIQRDIISWIGLGMPRAPR